MENIFENNQQDQTQNETNTLVSQPVETVNTINTQEEKTSAFSNIDLSIDHHSKKNFNIKVIGIGGAGCNVINYIAAHNPVITNGATLYAFNTDLNSLQTVKNVQNVYLLNKEELKGYGSGGDPKIGARAVEHDAAAIKQELQGTDLLFIIAGMGKGAGSGGAPELAKIAKELGILTVAIVNMPSAACEGTIIYNNAYESLQSLISFADSISTISNEKIVSNKKDISFFEAYNLANDEIANIIEDLINIIFVPTVMNIDFSDLRTFFQNNKFFMMNRIKFASSNVTQQDIKNALEDTIFASYSDVNIEGCKYVICDFKLSKSTPTTFVADINRGFAQITHNDNISLVYGVNYTDDDTILLSFLASGSNFACDFRDIKFDSKTPNTPKQNTQQQNNDYKTLTLDDIVANAKNAGDNNSNNESEIG